MGSTWFTIVTAMISNGLPGIQYEKTLVILGGDPQSSNYPDEESVWIHLGSEESGYIDLPSGKLT